MISRSKTFFRPSSRRALTLIEVVAAIALLGLLLSGIVLAQGRQIRQRALAQQKLNVIELSDQLLASWMEGGSVPESSVGTWSQLPDWQWSTQKIDHQTASDLGAIVVRFRVDRVEKRVESEPLLIVDLMVPEPEESETVLPQEPARAP